MAIRKRKPTSAGRRFQSASDFAEITKTTPEKSLVKPKPRTGGRNAHRRLTARHRGGGHQPQHRVVDLRPDKDRALAKVAAPHDHPHPKAPPAPPPYPDRGKR